MVRLGDSWKSFRARQDGNVGMIFALAFVPIVAASGVAIDYQSASNTRSVLQTEADAAALEVVRAAVEIQTGAATASKTASERNEMIAVRASQIIAARKANVLTRASMTQTDNLTFTGGWDDGLKTEYKVTAGADIKRWFRLDGGSSVQPVSIAATAKMDVTTSTTTSVPKLANPGYEAGDYNRIYAYCYDASKKNDANKGRSQMTPVSSNGTQGNSNTPELQTNNAFKNVQMPVCGPTETLSWRLYNVRDQRTNPNKWPKDTWNNTTKLWEQTDKTGVTIYNHYSDTTIDSLGKEEYAFRGDAFGYNYPINMMETRVCDTMDECTPGKPGATTPSGKNRKPEPLNQACAPGKFMYIGWEDRPFLAKDPNKNDYSTNNSWQWTDSDYDDITLVISCPEKTITAYKTKIWLIK
jgi:Flp pilus assembly protein TadG